jgi:hypothetical protein
MMKFAASQKKKVNTHVVGPDRFGTPAARSRQDTSDEKEAEPFTARIG